MQMRSGHAARGSAESEPFSNCNALPFMHIDAAEVHGERVQSEAVIDDDAISLVVERSCQYNNSTVGCTTIVPMGA